VGVAEGPIDVVANVALIRCIRRDADMKIMPAARLKRPEV
jgi:hypothetical protein